MKVHNNQVIELLSSYTFYEWVGNLGYNNIPYFKNKMGEWDYAPVNVEIGFADGRESYVNTIDNTVTTNFVNSFPIGKKLIIPDYSGCRYDGNYFYVKKAVDQWHCHYESAR